MTRRRRVGCLEHKGLGEKRSTVRNLSGWNEVGLKLKTAREIIGIEFRDCRNRNEDELGSRIFLNAWRFDGRRIGQRIEGRSHDNQTQETSQDLDEGGRSYHWEAETTKSRHANSDPITQRTFEYWSLQLMKQESIRREGLSFCRGPAPIEGWAAESFCEAYNLVR